MIKQIIYSYAPELEPDFGNKVGSSQLDKSFENAEAFNIGEIIRDVRKESHVTQSELASKLNVTKSYISRIENGLIMPGVNVFFRIIDALGMKVEIVKPIG